MNETKTIEKEDEASETGEEIREALTPDRITRPENRAFPDTGFTTDTSEALEAFGQYESPVFDLNHSGEMTVEPLDIDWSSKSGAEASQLYGEVAHELEDIFGEESVLHFHESLDLTEDLKTSKSVGSDSERQRMWMYVNGDPQMVVEGLISGDEVPEFEDVRESKWEIDHYLEEGLYLEEDEIIRSRVPRGERIVQVMNSEPDMETVDELEETWQEYREHSPRHVEQDFDYAEAFNRVKDMDYSAEDIREFASRHSELRESNSSRHEQRLGLMISALMNASEEDAFAVPGYWWVGYGNEGNDIYVENDGAWLGREMEQGTLSVPYSATVKGEPEGTNYSTEELGYLQITEARKELQTERQ